MFIDCMAPARMFSQRGSEGKEGISRSTRTATRRVYDYWGGGVCFLYLTEPADASDRWDRYLKDGELRMSYYSREEQWLGIAGSSRSDMITSECRPVCVVRPEKDPSGFQGWKMERVGPPESVLGVLQERKAEFALDFGVHIVGSLKLAISLGEQAADAPLRLRFVFAEVPAEIGEAFDPFQGGLSRAWLQDAGGGTRELLGSIASLVGERGIRAGLLGQLGMDGSCRGVHRG